MYNFEGDMNLLGPDFPLIQKYIFPYMSHAFRLLMQTLHKTKHEHENRCKTKNENGICLRSLELKDSVTKYNSHQHDVSNPQSDYGILE